MIQLYLPILDAAKPKTSQHSEKLISNPSKTDLISNENGTVPRRIPSEISFPNLTEYEILQMLRKISKDKTKFTSTNKDASKTEYFVNLLNDTDGAVITPDQYEILKLIQDINPEVARASFMSQVIRCIRSLSFIRCVGIFVWPMIANNLPFSASGNSRNSKMMQESSILDPFGFSYEQLETELLNRKQQIESNFVELYKNVTEKDFEIHLGPIKVRGHGDGEVTINYVGTREGRFSKVKDNKRISSIMTVLGDMIEEVLSTKETRTKDKKGSQKKIKNDRSLQVSGKSKEEENSKAFLEDHEVINLLLDKLKPSVSDVKGEDSKNYFDIEDAYKAFEVLFGPKFSGPSTNQLKSIDDENLKKLEKKIDTFKKVDKLGLISINTDETPRVSSRSRAMDESNGNSSKNDVATPEQLSIMREFLEEYADKYWDAGGNAINSTVTVKFPNLKDPVDRKKAEMNLNELQRDLKSKMQSMAPAAGLAASFLIQLALAHAKAAASVATLMSNMALGSAMLGLARDMIFGSNTEAKVKYVYETEKPVSPWSPYRSDSTISFTPPSGLIQPITPSYFK